MSTVYHKAIEQLSTYLHISKANKSVRNAIKKLENQAEEERIMSDVMGNAKQILEELNEKNRITKLEEREMVRTITSEFFRCQKFGHQNFLELSPLHDRYSLEGHDDVTYSFQIDFMHDDTVVLTRPRNGYRRSVVAGFKFDEVPTLKTEEIKKDLRIIKDNLKGLYTNLKKCWENINVKETPAPSSETSGADVEEFLASEERAVTRN